MNNLAPHLVRLIAAYLPPFSIPALSLTSHQFHKTLTSQDSLILKHSIAVFLDLPFTADQLKLLSLAKLVALF